MATESPIRILEGTDRWRTRKQSTRYRPSSAEMSIDSLGLFLRDQSLEKDVIPSRSESAPPSMEGSLAAVENIFPHRKNINHEKMSGVDGSLGLPRKNSLPVHEEESEDDRSSEHSRKLDSTQDTSQTSSPSYDQYCALTYKPMDEKPVSENAPFSADSNQISPLDGTSGDAFNVPQNTVLHQQDSYTQIIYPGIINNHAYSISNQFHHNPPTISTAEIQPTLYTSATAYMPSPGPFLHNLSPVGFVALQYNSPSGYNWNSAFLPSYLSGYPHQGTSLPVPGISNGYDPQNMFKFYGRVGFPIQLQPPFHMQYVQPPLRDAYGSYSHFDHQTPRDGAGVNQVGFYDSKKERQHLNLKSGNVSSHYYFGSPTHVGPLSVSPVVQPKPAAETNLPGGRYYNKSNGQNQTWRDTNLQSFLEELKSGKGQRLELVDQHGSRFIQQKLETCSAEEKEAVFKEVVPQASKLIADVFGNYVVQKLFEHGNPEQRMYLASQLEGQILPLSFQMYGCRVIQKALDVIDLEQKTRLVRELDGHVLRCVRDQNGNHVIQKCIESIPTDNIHFIISSFRGQVATLSMHPYGCRVIQRFLEHCNDDIQTQFIVDEILDSVCTLAQDQYGNYVTQHVLERGKPHERSRIIEKLAGSIVQLSQHKFASNVIEKCIEYSDSTSRGMLIKEIIGDGHKNDNLLIMMKDQYANYVIQRILEKCSSEHREVLLGQIKNHLTALKKYTYGKHIVTRFEQLYGDG
ncbi:pumilio homolog 5 [Phtheirospermum japonicum]|uniref:Pumilio homolog 5 n=1 Tax=Phtheirospermum japonicum TaxID=374723 RepID=A0A830BSK5_9LAMI|nr:pumilio homolog 5 [Phtheirospermum japonicum]